MMSLTVKDNAAGSSPSKYGAMVGRYTVLSCSVLGTLYKVHISTRPLSTWSMDAVTLAYSIGNTTKSPTITGATAGLTSNVKITITATVGAERNKATTGARILPTIGTNFANTPMAMAKTREMAKQSNTLPKVDKSASQNAPLHR